VGWPCHSCSLAAPSHARVAAAKPCDWAQYTALFHSFVMGLVHSCMGAAPADEDTALHLARTSKSPQPLWHLAAQKGWSQVVTELSRASTYSVSSTSIAATSVPVDSSVPGSPSAAAAAVADAEFNRRDRSGRTPLALACRAGHGARAHIPRRWCCKRGVWFVHLFSEFLSNSCCAMVYRQRSGRCRRPSGSGCGCCSG
jgi:hypothetical protein